MGRDLLHGGDTMKKNILEINRADNLRRMKAWIKKSYRDDLKYPDLFCQEMDTIIAAAKELKLENHIPDTMITCSKCGLYHSIYDEECPPF